MKAQVALILSSLDGACVELLRFPSVIPSFSVSAARKRGFFYMKYKSAAMSIKFLLFISRYSHDISICGVGCQGSSDTPSRGNSNLLHLHNQVTENKHLIYLVNQNTVILGPLWFFFYKLMSCCLLDVSLPFPLR